MAPRRKKKKSNNPLDYVYLPKFNLSDHAKRSLYLLLIIVLGLVSLLALFNLAGHFGLFIAHWLKLIFGWGRWLVPIILFYWAWLIIKHLKNSWRFLDFVGLVLLFISYQTLFHFFIKQADWALQAANGEGGGYIGWYLSRLVFYVFGFWGGVVILVALFLISLVLIFNTSLAKIFGSAGWLGKLWRPLATFFGALFGSEDETGTDTDSGSVGQKYVSEAREEILSAWQNKAVPAKLEKVEDETMTSDEYEGNNPAAAKKDSPAVQEKIRWPKRKIKIDLPVELLDDELSQAHGGDIALNRDKIQKTLEKFGIPVDMGESQVGPTVTQYTFRPAEGIKLSRITTLNNDLSLALAAHPIRIEAPIPGKSLVGVEVPNQVKAIVGLREILEDKAFKKRKNNLYVALGKDVAGQAWLYDLTKMPHLLVAGATNSGKSVCLNAIIVSLLYQNNPSDLRFIMVDPKRVELPIYNGIPHLLTPVITDSNKTINALRWCLNEMERRYDLLSKAGKRNIQSYNAVSSVEKLPYIVFIIDELADFMITSGKDMEAAIIRLAQMSRAIGIHLILATQRPSVDVITGLIKANISTRVAFSVASLVDSKTILDASGAEKLLGRGDMLFSSAEMSKPKRIQGAYLSDSEINDVVNYIKDQSGPADYLEGVTDRQKVAGNAGVGLDGLRGDEDELFESAKEIIIKANKASTSMLQRRLSIGYGRAAKILDMLEESGIIGPPNGSKPREVLISRQQYEDSLGESMSGVPIHDRSASTVPNSYLNKEANDAEDGEDALVFNSESMNSENKAGESEETEEADNQDENDDSDSGNSDLGNPDSGNSHLETKGGDTSQNKSQDKSGVAAIKSKPVKSDQRDHSVSHPLNDDDEMFFAR